MTLRLGDRPAFPAGEPADWEGLTIRQLVEALQLAALAWCGSPPASGGAAVQATVDHARILAGELVGRWEAEDARRLAEGRARAEALAREAAGRPPDLHAFAPPEEPPPANPFRAGDLVECVDDFGHGDDGRPDFLRAGDVYHVERVEGGRVVVAGSDALWDAGRFKLAESVRPPEGGGA